MSASSNLDALVLRALAETNWWETSIAPRLHLDASDCLVWTGSLSKRGYGTVGLPLGITGIPRRCAYVHRVALVRNLGRPLGTGMETGHLCHDAALAAGLCESSVANPCLHQRCVNHEHLAEQTHRQNALASGSPLARNAVKTECPKGHPLTGENVRLVRPGISGRACKACERDRRSA